MSTFDPSGLTVMGKANGQILFAEDLKEEVNLVKAQFNGKIGNVNISSSPSEKISASKLDLAGAIVDADIVSISVSKFSSLKVSAQSSPNNTVAVAAGTFIKSTGLGVFSYAGGNSPTFPLPSVATNRIDLLVIDDAGTLSRVVGTEAASPVPPDYPTNKVPLAEIYVRYNAGGVVIRETDNGVDSYIKIDARPFFRTVEIPDNTITGEKIQDYAIGTKKLSYWEQEHSRIANALGVTFDPRPIRVKAVTNADAQPCGHGAVRGNKVYFACRNRDYLAEWDHVADTMNTITLVSGDHPCCVVKIGNNLYTLCEDAYKIKKIDANNVVTTACDLTTQGAASGAWTLVNGLTPNGDGTILYCLAKITGTPVSRLLRVVLATPAVTHAWDFGAGNALMNPQFIQGADGTQYVVVHGLNGTNCTLERRLASDLSAAGSFAVGATTAAGGTFLGSDGHFCYVWDDTAGNVRVVDCSIATMADVGRFPINQNNIAGAANEVTSRLFLSTTAGENHYPYFTGRSILMPPNINRPAIMTAIPCPDWGGAYQVLLTNAGATVSVNSFACDGEYIFGAISDGAASGAQIARILA
jgi:hypothetical protein